MAASKKRDNDGESRAALPIKPLAESPSKPVSVGDVVLYAHRRIEVGPDGYDYSLLPMMVTEVMHDGETIAGVIYGSQCGPVGSKFIPQTSKGSAGGQWRPRA